MEPDNDESYRASEEGTTSSPEDLSRPVSYHNQWVMKGLPAWAHAGLPHGWTKTTHQSGLPIYYHRESRVVVLCKPYQLGNADLKTHKIPISAIPCMFYDALCNKKPLPFDTTADQSSAPDVRLFNPTSNRRRDSGAIELGCLSEDQVRSYCENKFNFECISVPYFRNFSAKCKYRKGLRKVEAMSEDEGAVTRSNDDITVESGKNGGVMCSSLKRPLGTTKEESTPGGKRKPVPEVDPAPIKNNYTCQLHTLCSNRLGCCLSYECLPPLTDQPDDRYRVRVKLGDRQYCQGSGPNKKAAKMEAARKTLLLLNAESSARHTGVEAEAHDSLEVAGTDGCPHVDNLENETKANGDDSLEKHNPDVPTESSDCYEEVDENPERNDDMDREAEGVDGERSDEAVGDDKLRMTPCSSRISQQTLDLFSRYDINSEMVYDLCQNMSCPTPYALLKRMIYLDAFQFKHGLQEEVRTFSGRIQVKLTCRRYKAVLLEDHSKKWFAESFRAEAVSMKNKEEGCSRAAQKIISKMMPSLKTYSDALLLLQSWEVLVGNGDAGFLSSCFGSRLGAYQREKCQGIDWNLLGEINSELRSACDGSNKPDYLFEF